MKTERLDIIKRDGWPAGPWDDEPDKAQWKTRAGLPALVVRNQVGALCGDVGVPKSHAAHGRHYDSVDVSVHGGLTYANACSLHICHEPEPGEPDDVWWLGFDTIHLGDDAPKQLAEGPCVAVSTQ